MKAVLGIAAFESGVDLGTTATYEVGKRQIKTISLKAVAEEVPGVSLKISFGVDPTLVETYNQANGTAYEVLPGEAYKFGEQDIIMPRFNEYSAESQLTLIGQGCVEDQFYVLPVVITRVTGSENYAMSETKNVVYFLMKVLPSENGTGLPDDPFLLEDIEDLTTMHEKLIPGETVYFKMTADIDMTPVTTWVPLNPSDPYDKFIHFDGDGHTISNFSIESGSYTSFFGVLTGTVENVTFRNASVTGNSNCFGVIGGYVGTGDKKGTVRNVKFYDSKVEAAGSQQHGGLVAGRTGANALIENVYVENSTVKTGRYAGFIAGCDAGGGTTIRNCYIKGGSVYGNQQAAGIIGMLENVSSVQNCGHSGNIGGEFGIGGVVGRLNGGGKLKVVENSFMWGDEVWCIKLTPGDNTHYSSGAVVGTAQANAAPYTMRNCVYKAGLKFQDYTDINVLGETGDVVEGALAGDGKNQYNYPWHAKASDAKSASEVAKALGWDEAIWDLSGDEPKLK